MNRRELKSAGMSRILLVYITTECRKRSTGINQIFKNTMHSKHVYLFEDKTHISQMVILEAVFEQAPFKFAHHLYFT